MSNRYHNEFPPQSDSHFGSQFSFVGSYPVEENDRNKVSAEDLYGSKFDLDHQYEGPFVPTNDVGVYQDGWEELTTCPCTIL